MKVNPRHIETREGRDIFEEEYRIPLGITKLERRAFHLNSHIRKVIFPMTLTRIGANAFEECSALEEVKFSKLFFLSSIGSYAFENCKKLKEINIPDSVKSIEYGAFCGCENLEKAKLPKHLKAIEYNMFSKCKNLKEVELPTNLKAVMSTAFEECTSLNSIKFPIGLKRIEFGAFRYCTSLENIVFPSSLEEFGEDVFYRCTSLKSIKIPRKIKELSGELFRCCTSLTDVELPKNLEVIGRSVFEDCVSLQTINLPEKLKKIERSAFQDCSGLKEIVLPEGLLSFGSAAFQGCNSLETIVIPPKVTEIPSSAFKYCTMLKSVKIPDSVSTISSSAFKDCTSLTRIEIPANAYLGDEAFAGCRNLEEIVFNGPTRDIGNDVFKDCGFKYIYKVRGTDKIVLAKSIPQTLAHVEQIVELNELTQKIEGLDISKLTEKGCLHKYLTAAEKIDKAKVYIPIVFIEKLNEINKLDKIGREINFKFFKGEIPNMKEEIDKLGTEEEIENFYKFAMLLGCFSTEKMLNKDGEPTGIVRGQKASSFVGYLLKNDVLPKGMYTKLFKKLEYEDEISQDFLNFISVRGAGKTYQNLELLLRMEQKYPGIIIKVARNFKSAEAHRVELDNTGRPHNLSWEEALVKFYSRNAYEHITPETREIADLFLDKGIEEGVYNEAVKIHKKAKQTGVKSHILSVHLREETILETIEKVKASIDSTLVSNKKLIEELYDKKFTFEFLDKYDPHNAIMGIFCSCCGTITSRYYGKQIAEASISAKDVQNLVVRDTKGEIVAKGTMYVSPYGYAVINDFEINEKYKNHEDYQDGFYRVKEDHIEAQERELIFKALMRGIHSFVKQYDLEHPDCPIKKVNVGMGYNRLKLQCMRYRDETRLLKVPAEYNFKDAADEQRVLYERGKNPEISEERSI